jgi:hypothetical protein
MWDGAGRERRGSAAVQMRPRPAPQGPAQLRFLQPGSQRQIPPEPEADGGAVEGTECTSRSRRLRIAGYAINRLYLHCTFYGGPNIKNSVHLALYCFTSNF